MAVRRVEEGAARNLVSPKDGRATQWSATCCQRDVHDSLADGKTTNENTIQYPFPMVLEKTMCGRNQLHGHLPKDTQRLHRF